MSETAPPADPSDAADPSPSVESPATGPLRLDGAFARCAHEDWVKAADDSLDDGTTLDSLAHRTLDDLRVEVLYDDSPVRGRLTPDIATIADADARPGAAADGDAGIETRTDSETDLLRARRARDARLAVLGADPASANAHALAGLEGGVTSLELRVRPAIASAAAGAHDIDPPLSLDALDEALRGVHLDMITLSLRAGDDTSAALDALLSLYGARGLDPRRMHAALDGDPLGELARAGGTVEEVEGRVDDALARLAGTAARAASELPLARVCAIDMTVHHEAGASPVQELVAGIAAATSTLEHLADAGLAPATLGRAIAFRASVEADIVGGVVKLRALERLWRHVLAASGLLVHAPPVVAETSRRQQSRLAPWVNHLRNVAGATAAMIGDADVLLVHPHDRVDGRRLGDEAVVADRVARNLPVLLAEECGLGDVADAAGGAHAIESLTQAMVEAVWHELGALQTEGGLVAALASGSWQRALARTHAARVERLRDGEGVRVGVNRFRHAEAPPLVSDRPNEADPSEASAVADGTSGVAAADSGDAAASGMMPLRAVREATAFEGPDGPERAA